MEQLTNKLSEEEKKDYVYKMNVPIFNNLELKELDYKIENYLDDIVSEISKTVSRDREIIILKKVIEKQQEQLQEKDKIINAMAKLIEKHLSSFWWYEIGADTESKKDIIEYFTKKAREK